MAVVDFTTYTETDPGSKITVTSTKVAISTMPDNAVYNVYKDYGTDYFDSLNTFVELYLTSGSNNGQFGPGFVNTATPGTEARGTLATTDCWVMLYYYNAADIRLTRGAYVTADISVATSTATLYYCTFSRTAGSDTVTFYIYSNAGRTTLVDTLSVAGYGTGTKWQYQYALLMHAGSDGSSQTGYIQNLDLNIASSGPANLKSYNTNVLANIKSINTNLIANVKSLDTNV